MSDSVSIDKLTIDVDTNATLAKDGIEKLADALGRLKQNGSFGTAVKNLNNLSDALKKLTSVTSNANKLTALATSVDQLSKAGSFARVINQLNKLPGALKGLSSLNIDNDLGVKLEKLAQATTPLSNIKTGGLGTMVNALGKIGAVTKSLDDDTINRFADRVDKLSQKLTPLSSKMTTVQAGLRGINSSAKAAGNGVKQLGTKVNATAVNMASVVTVIQGVVHALMPLVRLFSSAIGSAMEWDGISYQFGNAFGEQADEYHQKITEITDALKINKQTFMENSAMATSMLKGFGVGSDDARKMGVGYTELAYDIWAAFNNVYKSLDGADGAMAAVRSAISGEVEPIRRAGFTIVDSQLKITAANHGIAYSSDKATEAQKSYLRYLTLVDQAQTKGIVGAYAYEMRMNTAEALTRTLTQQVKSLGQAFGSLFLPILVKILPWLQAFVDLLTEAVVWVAGFFGIDIQPATWNNASNTLGGIADSADTATGSLGDTADAVDKTTEALKDLKNATIGIDELNVISPPTENAGSGGSGGGVGGAGGGLGAFEGLDVESLWDESIWNNVKSQVDEIKQKVKDFFDEWETEIKIIAGLLAALGMAKMLEHLGQALGLGDKFLGVMKTISKLAVTGIIITLQYTLMAEFFDKFIDGEGFKEYVKALFVGAIGTGILYSMWGPAGLVIGLSVIAAASLKAIIDNGGITNVESAMVALTGFAAAVGAVAKAWPLMAPVIAGIKDYVSAVKQMAPEVGLLNATFPQLAGHIATFSGKISGAWGVVSTFLAGISAPVWAAIVAAIVALIGTIVFLKENWDEVTAAAKRFFDEKIAPKIDEIKQHFQNLVDALGPVGEFLAEFFGGLWESIKRVVDNFNLIEGLGAVLEFIGGVVVGVLGGTIAGAFDAAVSVIEGFVQAVTGIVEIVSGVVQALVKLFEGDLSGAWEACKLIGQGIADVFGGLYDMTIGAVIDFVEGIIDWCVYLWDELVGHSIIPDTIDGIVECFLGLPGKVLGKVGEFVGGIIDKFKDFGSKIVEKVSSGWDKVKSWWGGKSGMETTEVGVKLVKQGWTTIKGWIGSIPGVSQAVSLVKSGWTSIKKWIGSTSVISQGISLAKSGWKTVKGWIGGLPTLSQSIKLVKSKWTSVKKWIGTIPVISQAVKLAKSGWSSVKGWIGKIPTMSIPMKLVKSGWSTIKNWLGNLNFKISFSLPRIGVNWGSKTFAGFKISYPTGFYTYAKGGFPDIGELFVAREAGPEMVGKIGNKTTVANNQQIVEGISEGVYSAMVAAMKQSEGNGGQAFNIYLDGRQLVSTIEKRQRERGATIMRNGVYAY